MKILLLDDSLKHRRAGIRQLTTLGHDVVAFSSYCEALERAASESFDAALVDMLMPAERQMLGPRGTEEYFGAEIGIGYAVILKLALLGVKRIAMATDTNHHDHPLSAAVDWFIGQQLTINGAQVLIMHAPAQDDGVKDWAKILSHFT